MIYQNNKLQPCLVCKCAMYGDDDNTTGRVECTSCDYRMRSEAAHQFICDCVELTKSLREADKGSPTPDVHKQAVRVVEALKGSNLLAIGREYRDDHYAECLTERTFDLEPHLQGSCDCDEIASRMTVTIIERALEG